MANKIKFKNSSVANKVPVVEDLDFGELALNYTDGKLYYKKSDATTIDYFTASSPASPLPINSGGTGGATAPAAQANLLGYTTNSSSGISTTAATGTGATSASSSSISGNTLTIGGTIVGTFAVGMVITGTNVTANTIITGILSGNGTTAGSTFSLSASSAVSGIAISSTGVATLTFSPTASTTSGTITGNVLTVSGTITGAFFVGMTISGTNVIGTPIITSLGTGVGGAGTYFISVGGQNVSATTITGTLTTPPYAVGSYIGVTGITPTGYLTNGMSQVTACTTTTVSYTNATTGAQSVGGVVTGVVPLSNASSFYQLFTGTTIGAVSLPDTSTLQQGWTYRINNAIGTTLILYTATGAGIGNLASGSTAYLTCIDTTTNTAAGWRFGVTEVSSATGTGSMVLSSSPTIIGTLNFTGSSASSIFLGTAQTTGAMSIGNTSQTGIINIGRSTSSQPVLLGSGAITATGTLAIATGSSISGTTLTLGTVTQGTFAVGMAITGTNVLASTYIISGSGLSWVVSQSQTVASTTITGTSQKSIDIGPYGVSGSLTNITLGSALAGSTSITNINGTLNAGLGLSYANYIQVTGGATNAGPIISSQGSDPSVDLLFSAKGTAGSHVFRTNGTTRQFQVSHVTSAVNYIQATGGATTKNVIVSAQSGTDTDVGFALQPKGTGAINLAPGTSGVNISNGGTVTAITGTAGGSYTTIPTFIVSAPTTPGGTQASGSCAMLALATTLVSGGTGYTVGDIVTLTGGTFTQGIVLKVDTISGAGPTGPIVTFTVTNGGTYTALPSNPISQGSVTNSIGGASSGTGATFSSTWQVRTTAFTILVPGSGYVEQPTITFSSGTAQAYATVGGGTIIRSLGSTGTQSLSFHTPSGELLRMRDTGTAGPYAILQNTSSGVGLFLAGSVANATLDFNSAGTGQISFGTNGNSGNTQFRVAHRDSAQNYVQVQGSATNAAASALGGLLLTNNSTTGQDTSTNFAIGVKGSGYIAFYGSAATNAHAFRVSTTNATSSGNLIIAQGAVAGSAPSFTATSNFSGTDTNVSMALLTKGAGSINLAPGGAVNLAPGSSGVNISNGGTVTAITRTNGGSGYTSAPSVIISLPTTSSGVRAEATSSLEQTSTTASIVTTAGSGYSVNDVITVSGGTQTTPAGYTVTQVDGNGGITGLSLTQYGNYSVAPSNPVSVTVSAGSPGVNARLTLTWQVRPNFIINPGSGYVEQPTVTIDPPPSGTTATAYASVGASAIVKSIHGSITFTGTRNTLLNIADTGNSSQAYMNLQGSNGNTLNYANGAATNVGIYSITKGNGQHSFTTNGSTSTEQFRITHTDNAVNWVQVTGGATTKNTIVSAQSTTDTDVGLTLQSRGISPINLAAGGDGVYISNGTSVTAIKITNGGSGYVTPPNITISDPKTPGGVKAVATCTITGGVVNTITVDTPGSGYTEPPIVTIDPAPVPPASGTTTLYAIVGNVTGFRSLNTINMGTPSGFCLQLLDNGTSNVNFLRVRGGANVAVGAAGSDANVNLLVYSRGTGYVDISTNSGATAQVRVNNVTGADRFVELTGGVAGTSAPGIGAHSTEAFDVYSRSNAIRFSTNGKASATQLQIAHTASAVNYVQVTGAVNGSLPIISAQGTGVDSANVGLILTSKGAANLFFKTNNNGSLQFIVPHTTGTIVNQTTASGSVEGQSPIFGVTGTDTNIDLTLAPKGTGKVVVTSPIQIDTHLVLDTTTATTTTTDATVIASVDASIYRAVKFLIRAVDSTNAKYHTSEVLAIHNGATANSTEYASINIGGICATFDVDYLAVPGTIRLLATPTTASSTVFTVALQLLK